jgi:hypothetical protein
MIPLPPTDPAAYAPVTWTSYGHACKAHWAYRPLDRVGWRTLCGSQEYKPTLADPEAEWCRNCATRYAKIVAAYDASHSIPTDPGV